MNLNINRIKLMLVMAAAFFICCSMSSKCNTPGPETEVHGVVTDGITGKPLDNLQMEVATGDFDPHYFTTNTDGSYDYKFTPEISTGKYSLFVHGAYSNNYLFPGFISVTQGINNDIDYPVYPGINVTVHLINHTDHGQNQFYLSAEDTLSKTQHIYDAPNGVYLTDKVVIDTTFVCPLPHYTYASFISSYFSYATPTVKTNSSQTYYFGNKDTTITINNP